MHAIMWRGPKFNPPLTLIRHPTIGWVTTQHALNLHDKPQQPRQPGRGSYQLPPLSSRSLTLKLASIQITRRFGWIQ